MHHIRLSLPVSIMPSENLYIAVRTALIAKGTTLNAWCKANRVTRQTMEKALKGQREGRRSRELRERLINELFPRKRAA